MGKDIDEIGELESNLDQTKRLLFTETRMKAASSNNESKQIFEEVKQNEEPLIKESVSSSI